MNEFQQGPQNPGVPRNRGTDSGDDNKPAASPRRQGCPSERDLMGKFGTSRNPIREALRVLESLGFVSVRPGSGTYVNDPLGSFSTPPSKWNLEHTKVLHNHYEARLVIEPGIAALAAKRATPEDLKSIAEAKDELSTRLTAGDVLGGMLSDARFHWLIAKSSGNRNLTAHIGNPGQGFE